MRFLRTDQLRPEILAERAREKRALGSALHRDDPRHNRERDKDDAGNRIEPAQPAPIAVGDRQRNKRQRGDRRTDRAFQQDRRKGCDPEECGQCRRDRPAGPRSRINKTERALRRNDRGEQCRIGFRDMRFGDEHNRAAEQHRREQCRLA